MEIQKVLVSKLENLLNQHSRTELKDSKQLDFCGKEGDEMLSPSALRIRIVHIFNESNGATRFTTSFENLAPTVQAFFEKHFVKSDELPIVASYHSIDSWVLMTTSHLLFNFHGQHAALPWDQIRFCAPTDLAEPHSAATIKYTSQKFAVTTEDGHKFTFETEPGAAFMSFWNALLGMIRK